MPLEIVGSGLVAGGFFEAARTACLPNSVCRVLAFGVSNSTCTERESFGRDASRVRREIAESDNVHLVYLSTTSIAMPCSPKSPYVEHKMAMEAEILANGGSVFRFGQLVGFPVNRSNVVNVFYDRILAGQKLCCWRGAQRRIMSALHAAAIAIEILRRNELSGSNNRIVDIAAPYAIGASELASVIGTALNRQPIVEYLDTASSPVAMEHLEECSAVAGALGITLDSNYCVSIVNEFVRKRMRLDCIDQTRSPLVSA